MTAFEQPIGRQQAALITGAVGGLGKAFAVECASRGWNLFLTDQSGPLLETLADGLRSAYHVRIITQACDLTDPAQRAGLFDRLRDEGMRLTALINVAGVDYEGLFYGQTGQQIQNIVRLNVEGTLAMTHAALPFREPHTPFRIINVSSLAAFSPMPAKATYAASKRFLLDFSLALREEVRSLNATVTALCPAGMPTSAECIQAIEAQGWAGQVTTTDVGRVANLTLNAALAGKAVVIPGWVNQVLQKLGGLVPAVLAAHLVGRRWLSVREKRAEQGELQTV